MMYQNLLYGTGTFCSREGIVMIKRGSDPARPFNILDVARMRAP